MINPFKIIDKPEKRYFGFDIIRAFSVILVMNMHFLQHSSLAFGLNYFLIPLPDPVDMFFVCSGFLIGYNFLKDMHKTEKVDMKFTGRFLIMRWVRTLPAYYFMLIFLMFFNILVTQKFKIPYLNFAFLQNLYLNKSTFYRETWTISVEEWFYISFPLLFMLFIKVLKLSKDKIYLCVIFFMLIGSISLKIYYYNYVYTEHTFQVWASSFREIVVLRLDTIAIGLLSAYICYHYENIWLKYRYKMLAIGLSIYVLSIFYYWAWSNEMLKIEKPELPQLSWSLSFAHNAFSTFYHFILFYIVSPISVALCLPYLKTIKYKPTFVNKFILYTSLISYSLFLLHGTFLLTVGAIIYGVGITKNIILIYAIWLVLCYLLSDVFYNKVELPFMKKRKWIIEKFGFNK